MLHKQAVFSFRISCTQYLVTDFVGVSLGSVFTLHYFHSTSVDLRVLRKTAPLWERVICLPAACAWGTLVNARTIKVTAGVGGDTHNAGLLWGRCIFCRIICKAGKATFSFMFALVQVSQSSVSSRRETARVGPWVTHGLTVTHWLLTG